ncbi:unnamed protein product [Clavelina lepadiformis]|uniref:Uncharacterized protein n=1 Tax=Clavelina lepadiformis TaxID=159417 RepID=A0ABP0F0Z0_CLALP
MLKKRVKGKRECCNGGGFSTAAILVKIPPKATGPHQSRINVKDTSVPEPLRWVTRLENSNSQHA